MNHSKIEGASHFSSRLSAAIHQGWHDVMDGLPPAEFPSEIFASNYEIARQWAVEHKRLRGVRSFPPGPPPEWLSVFIRKALTSALQSDNFLPALVVGHERFRPKHLVQADLANALRAAGLESLQSPTEETY